LEQKKAEFKKPLELESRVNTLENELASLKANQSRQDLSMSHPWKEETCTYNKNGYCVRFSLLEEPNKQRLPSQIEFTRLEDGHWHIKTSPKVCSPCTLYRDRSEANSLRKTEGTNDMLCRLDFDILRIKGKLGLPLFEPLPIGD
jgi:hypothetical protein